MGAEALTEPRDGRPGPSPDRPVPPLAPRRYGVAVLRFAAAHGMLTPKYAALALRFLRRRLLTVAGRRWRTDGMLFLGPRLQLQIGRNGQIRFGRPGPSPDRPVPPLAPRRYGVAVLRFAAAHGMLTPKYAALALRFLRRRLLTAAGRRWRTDGMLFLGPRLQLQIGRNGQIRFGRFVWLGHGTKIRCHEGQVEIGAKTVLGQECTISAYQRVSIGQQCVIADRVMLIDFDHNVADAEQAIRKQGIYKRDVVVGSNVWIGYGAQILRGVTVGDNAIIGASSVVTRDIPANAVAAGTPARVVRMRPAPEHLRWPDPVEPEGYGPAGPR